MTEFEINQCGEAAKNYADDIIKKIERRHKLSIEEKTSVGSTAIEDFMYGAKWASDNLTPHQSPTGRKEETTLSPSIPVKTEWHKNTPDDIPASDSIMVLMLTKGNDRPILGSTINGKFISNVEFWAPIDITAAIALREKGGEQ